MKARINYKSKKTIAIIAIIILLVITATVGTIAYIKNNNDSTAATENVTTENAASENTGENNAQEKQQNENNDNNNQNANTNSASSLGNSTGTSNPSNTANSSTNTGSNVNTNNNANSTSTNNNANAISTNNNANSTSTNNGNGITNTPNSEYTQTTIIPGTEKILVSEDTKIGWSPIMVNAEMPLADIYKANLKLSKIAFVNDDRNQTAAQKGETITYIIRVENPTDIEAKNIYAYDTIPEGTTLVENSIDNNGKNKDNKIEWKIESIKPKETIEVSFKVLVKDEKIDVIKNKATVNGNTTEEVKTPIIKTKKVAKIVSKSSDGNEVLLDRDAKVGEKIRYIISAKNDSEADGQTVITDSIPENAELVEGSISEGGSISDGKITWSNVKVGAGKTTEVSFDVIVGNTNESIKNKAIIGNTPTDEVDTKVANIVTEKTSKKISKDGKEIKDSENLHELDFIEYSLKVTNKGNGEGTAIIKDTVPTGTKIEGKVSLTGDTKNYSEKELNKGIEVKLNSNETRTITFKVKVQPFTDKTENVQMVNNVATLKIRNAEAKQDDKDVPPTEDLVEKEYTSIKGTKTWIAPEGKIHPDITINLLRDGEKVDSRTLKNGETTYSFDHLDKYDLADGYTYEYTTSEDNVEGYTSRRDGNNYTNTINQVKISVSGNKTWIAPKEIVHPEITINLLQDGKEIKETKLANGKTEYSFDNLDKYDLTDGHVYKYTVSEDKVNGYTTKQEGNNFINTIEQDSTVKVEGKKTWIDPEGTVHPDITINLLRDGEKVDSRTLQNGTTTYSFDNLNKYDLTDGHIYNYTVSEYEVKGYTTTQNGNDFTNTIDQEKISISGTKTWIGPAATAETRPTVTINLYRNDEFLTSTKLQNNGTTYSFTELDKYDLKTGKEYEYRVEEAENNNYTSEKLADSNGKMYNFKNTIKQVNDVNVKVTKKWIDPTGTTHPTITINLYRDNDTTPFKTHELTNGNTEYTFEKLERYDLTTGKEHTYRVEEATKLDDYQDPVITNTSNTNFTIVNTIAQKQINVEVTKNWIGAPNNSKYPSITIKLHKNSKNGEIVGTKTLTNENREATQKVTFDGLDEYDLATGEKIKYYVTEDPVKNYDVTYNQDTKTITNTYNQDIKGEITEKQIVTTESTDTAPLDVVFVLDVSGSMADNNKGSNMVSAVNSAMNTILNSNSENKVGIVTFSDSSSTLLPLGRYTANSNSEYLKYPLYSDRIETNLKNWNYSYKAISGGTYTQSGIKAGANMLINNSKTTYTTKNGETRSRIPLIILVTDGEPTYYASTYNNPTVSNRFGNGTQTTGDYGYYTIKTANYYKQQVQQHYFKNNDGGAKFYTIGTGMSGEFAKAVLDPSAENIKATNKGGSDDKRKQLYNLITEKNEINSLDYADASATGSFSSEQLTKLMNDFIKSNSVETTTRKITEEESNSRKVIIGDMDFETENALKEFKLIVNGTEYNTKSSAMQSGYLKQNATDGYYLDFSSIPDGNNVSFTMTYYKPEVTVKD